MKDYLVKALAYDGFVRAYAVSATETIAEAQRRHETWNTASAALGRAMVGSLLLGINDLFTGTRHDLQHKATGCPNRIIGFY